jgi:hypothetical protein
MLPHAENFAGGSHGLIGFYGLRKKCFFVIPSEARDLFFFSACKKQQIPRAKAALRNDMVRVFPQLVEQVLAEI